MLVIVIAQETSAQVYSALWGKTGEKWSQESRLPDFSYAGYRHGEEPLPYPAVTHNVRDFGAVGDGKHDDTEAFKRALAEVPAGVILVPEGRYVITDLLAITKPNLVLRGEGPEKTELYFPIPLNDIKPNWGATTSGVRTSNYSWSGGFLAIRGSYRTAVLAKITGSAQRAANSITVDDASKLAMGEEIEIRMQDTPDNTLARYLYSGDPRLSMEKLKGRVRISMVARITAIEGSLVTLDRSLHFDIRAGWNPTVNRFAPTVTDSGIEELRFSFPTTSYGGHFSELGNNAFTLQGVAHCWVRNIRIHNADSGGFVSGMFNTIAGVTYSSERESDRNRRATGHHGITLGGSDNLFTGFNFRTKFIHDMTTRNVFSNGQGIDLALDHHCHAPYENLFTNIDAGKGSRIWVSGGGKDLGAHCAGRGTFWNIRAAKAFAPPPSNFGPWSMNLIGVQIKGESRTDPAQRWYEYTAGTSETVYPANIHEAQLERRLRRSR
jgi:Pectate lyase superfamily protein